MGHGIITGWSKIASHSFFRTIDWYSIDSKQCQPVYIPPVVDSESQFKLLSAAQQQEVFFSEEEMDATAALLQQNNDGVMGWLCRQKDKRSSRTQNRQSQDMRLLEHNFKSFDYTIFDQYEGFLDEQLMTVGPPPDWVKPAFPDADNGSILPIRKLYLETTPTVFDIFSTHESSFHHHFTTAAAY
jgi:serine/threonine kinase 32